MSLKCYTLDSRVSKLCILKIHNIVITHTVSPDYVDIDYFYNINIIFVTNSPSRNIVELILHITCTTTTTITQVCQYPSPTLLQVVGNGGGD